MPPSDTAPLLGNWARTGERRLSFIERLKRLFKPRQDEPSLTQSYKHLFFGSWFNILLVFVPLSFVSNNLDWDPALCFSFSFLAIMPLAELLGTATDQSSLKLGQTLSAFLNVCFGNATEIIVGTVALLHGELRIVQTSLLGSILSTLVLVLGCSFFAAGIQHHESRFKVTAAQNSSSLMSLACFVLVIPAAYYASRGADSDICDLNATSNSCTVFHLQERYEHGLLIISRGTALLLLFVYVAYLVFQLKTHADLFAPHDGQEEEETSKMSTAAALSSLLLIILLTSFCADNLVSSIGETATRYGICKSFIGLILLPVVSNASQFVTSVRMAMKNKMELTIGICVGSSIQIATFVVPLLVIVGWITHHNLTLYFTNFETIVLFVSVMLVNLLIQDGKSNYMEGLILITLYLVIALAFFVS